ncbi:hypothetical protein Tco_1079299 [Tanacetum coccineum]|uniref:Retrotransposon gag domain-containing protein n=1 Tax=Tanacetum coccineum TaxID=301880 RepID=A0ABQ5HSB8_9ASTR
MRPEIKGNVNFEIKSQFLREVRDNTFFENTNEDAYEHVERVLEIISFFSIPEVSKDAIILRVFPLTLTGTTKRWMERVPFGTINTWDLLKRVFILRYCPPSKTAKHLESNRGPGGSNSDGMSIITYMLNDLGHDMRKLKKSVHAIQVGCEMCGGIHLGKDCHLKEEIKSIKVTGYRETKNGVKTAKYPIGPSGSYTIRENCSPFNKRPSLEDTADMYLEELRKRQDAYEKWMKKFRESTHRSLKKHKSAIKDLEKKVEQMAQAVTASITNESMLINQVNTVAAKSKDDESPQPKPVVGTHKEPGTFAKKVKRRITEEQEKIFLESLEKVPVNTPLIDTLSQTPYYTKSLQELVSKKKRIEEVSMVKLNALCSSVLQNKLPPKEKDPDSFIMPCIIGSMTVSNALADLGASISLVDKYTAEGDIEVFSIENHGLDWISAHNFLTHLQKLSSYASSHLKVSKLAACLDKGSFSCTSSHVKDILWEGMISSTSSHLGSIPVVLNSTQYQKYTLYPFYEVETVALKSIKIQKCIVFALQESVDVNCYTNVN